MAMYVVHYEGKSLGKVFADSAWAAIDYMASLNINAAFDRMKMKAFPIRRKKAGKEVKHA